MENKTTFWVVVISVAILIAIFLFQTSPEETTKVVCNSPYIQVGTDCCLDSNLNKICDKDEKIELEEKNLNEKEVTTNLEEEIDEVEEERKEIEQEYKVKLAGIPSGAQKLDISTYDWLPPLSVCEDSMKGWTLGGCTGCSACIYEEIVDNLYKTSIIIKYSDDHRTYRGSTVTVSRI